MEDLTLTEELLTFFKALADAQRLKIIGLLAQEPHTVEQLAALLNISPSTTSHHLSKLANAGLVEARTDGHYYFYFLKTDTLEAMAQRLLKSENLPRLSADVEGEAYERKIIQNFTDPSGRIKSLPAQEKKFQVLLRYVARAFQAGRRYTEKEVNEILARYHEDTASLRRGLVEYHLMERESSGKEYWLVEENA
ncbi:MAG: metalloregulator ArsR/SmtB family transcription factor [Bellilinea sp.]|nr:metalloregulator ArsR/SmtB family transcription factor [Bellilinea sp.]